MLHLSLGSYKIFDLSQMLMIRQILKDFKSTLKLCIYINIRNTPTLHFKCLQFACSFNVNAKSPFGL